MSARFQPLRFALLMPALFAFNAAYAQLTHYVAQNGQTPVSPYTSLATAATNIQDAVKVSAPGDTVLIYDGTYTIAQTAVPMVTITNAITVKSVNGPDAAILDIGGTGSTDRHGIYMMTNAIGAVVEGLTVRGAYHTVHSFNAGGFYLQAGVVTNCHIKNNFIGGAGGGVYITGGTLTDCLIVSNRANEWNYGLGGGIYQTGGLVKNCVVAYNSAGRMQAGGGIYLGNGTVQNCLIAFNQATRADDALSIGIQLGLGGGVYMTGGQLQHCTIADNYSRGIGGGVYMTAGSIINSIIYNNRNNSENPEEYHNIFRTGGTLSYSCAFPLEPGLGNIASEPCFSNRADNDFRLLPGSPCIDTAENIPDLDTDIAGSIRPVDGSGKGQAVADMGCYEAPQYNSGILRAGFTSGRHEYIESLNVTFTAAVAGAGTTITHYGWDFNNGGAIDMKASGSALSIPSQVFTNGRYNVELTLSNTLGETARIMKPAYVKVAPSSVYVSTAGADVFPYATPANASTSLEQAIEVAYAGFADGSTCSVVRVAPGAYILPGPIGVQKGIGVISEAGPAATRLVSGQTTNRCLNLTHSNAYVSGFTLKGADWTYYAYHGGAARVSYGTLTNCIISETRVGGAGGGIYVINRGLVTDSLISSNWCSEWQYGLGGGAAMNGGMIERCVFKDNYTLSHQGGGGAFVYSGAIRNCLFIDNSARRPDAGSEGDGGGALVTGTGQILNSTFYRNWAVKDGGGVQILNGGLTNSIVCGNWVTQYGAQNLHGLGGIISYSCSPDLPDDPGNGNISADPQFENPALNNFNLRPTSPCHRTGLVQAWMTNTTDIVGNPRILGNTVDRGCCQTGETRGFVISVY